MTASKGIFQRKIDVVADASDKVDTRALVDLVTMYNKISMVDVKSSYQAYNIPEAPIDCRSRLDIHWAFGHKEIARKHGV